MKSYRNLFISNYWECVVLCANTWPFLMELRPRRAVVEAVKHSPGERTATQTINAEQSANLKRSISTTSSFSFRHAPVTQKIRLWACGWMKPGPQAVSNSTPTTWKTEKSLRPANVLKTQPLGKWLQWGVQMPQLTQMREGRQMMNLAWGFNHRCTFSCSNWLQDLAKLFKFPSLITVNPKGPQVCLGKCLNEPTNIQVFSMTPGVVCYIAFLAELLQWPHIIWSP